MHRFLKSLEKSHEEITSVLHLKSIVNKTFFAMDLEKSRDGDFLAKYKRVDIGPLGFFGCYTSTSLIGVRRLKDIRGDVNRDHCLIYFPIKMQTGEPCWHYQGGKQSEGGEKIITMVEGCREYRVHRPTYMGLTLIVPRSLLQKRLPRLSQYCITPYDASRGPFALAWDLIMSVWYNHDSLSESSKLHYSSVIVDFLVFGFVQEETLSDTASWNTKDTYLHRALHYIDAHISSPAIGPDVIAENLGIKRRYLYEIFDNHEKTLAAVIRDKRLERCHETLNDQRMADLTITEIAYRWGFASYPHFSRLFKEKYAISPRDVPRPSRQKQAS